MVLKYIRYILLFCLLLTVAICTLVWQASSTKEYSRSTYGKMRKLPQNYFIDGPLITQVVYNRIGKCGSRSLNTIIHSLSKKNEFHFYTSPVGNVTRPKILDLMSEVRLIESMPTPMLYTRHIHFINFEKFGHQPPVYINVIRDPIERFVSQFYFKRYGDNHMGMSRLARPWHDGERDLDINTCVLRNYSECSGLKLWYVVPYFCGQSPICREPGRDALLRAKRHLVDNYLLVGVLEDFEGTLQVLEKLLPTYFNGAVKIWKKVENKSVKNTATRNKVPLTPEADAVLRDKMKLEYEFYDFAFALYRQLKVFQLGLDL
uniref:Uronyl 2-sulfotransferase-like n=1 Tax=Phallusia mammillata TaxID=59560 RepID=A0A6F9DX22_9ASCI|nr:uronyl 2-sulfotransferase-like [Phallusia mammillata]